MLEGGGERIKGKTGVRHLTCVASGDLNRGDGKGGQTKRGGSGGHIFWGKKRIVRRKAPS